MAEYHLGCVQLLTLCGPRLTELRLLGVQRWQASSYMFLRWCTALTKLELEAEAYNRTPGNDLQKCSIGKHRARCAHCRACSGSRNLRMHWCMRM